MSSTNKIEKLGHGSYEVVDSFVAASDTSIRIFNTGDTGIIYAVCDGFYLICNPEDTKSQPVWLPSNRVKVNHDVSAGSQGATVQHIQASEVPTQVATEPESTSCIAPDSVLQSSALDLVDTPATDASDQVVSLTGEPPNTSAVEHPPDLRPLTLAG